MHERLFHEWRGECGSLAPFAHWYFVSPLECFPGFCGAWEGVFYVMMAGASRDKLKHCVGCWWAVSRRITRMTCRA